MVLCIASSSPSSASTNVPSLEAVFDVEFTSDKLGGCKGHEADIRKSYKEALQIVSDASRSLRWLSSLKEAPKPAVNQEYDEFLRITQAYKLLLGNEGAWTTSGLNPSVKATEEVFEKYIESHLSDGQTNIVVEPRFYLRYGDNWLRFLDPNSEDLREQGKPGADEYTIAKPRAGEKAFPYGAMLPKGDSLVYVDSKPQDVSSPWCNTRVKAVSSKAYKLLILCPSTYMRPPAFGGGRNKHDFPNQAVDIEERDSLDMVDKVPAVTWVHEMGHYIMGWSEQQAPNPHNQDKLEPVYDLDMAVSLSKTFKGGEMRWPENLALFAAAMHLNKWYWASGVAKAKPEPGEGAGSHQA